jgi:hypothetical protein
LAHSPITQTSPTSLGIPISVMIRISDITGPTKKKVSAKMPDARPSEMYARSVHGVVVRGNLAIRQNIGSQHDRRGGATPCGPPPDPTSGNPQPEPL